MIDYRQNLREAIVGMDITTQEKATGLNILEQIFEGADINQLVEQIGNGTVPVVYVVKGAHNAT